MLAAVVAATAPLVQLETACMNARRQKNIDEKGFHCIEACMNIYIYSEEENLQKTANNKAGRKK